MSDLTSEIKQFLCQKIPELKEVKLLKCSTRDDYDFILYSANINLDHENMKSESISSLNSDGGGKYRIKLNRLRITRNVISSIIKNGSGYGFVTPVGNRVVIVNAPLVSSVESPSFDDLRSLYLTSFLVKLLEQNGLGVQLVQYPDLNSLELFIGRVLTNKSMPIDSSSNRVEPSNLTSNHNEGDNCEAVNSMANCINHQCPNEDVLLSDWFETLESRLRSDEKLSEIFEDVSDEGERKLKLDLKKFMQGNNIMKSYSANVNILITSPSDYSVKQLYYLESARSKLKNNRHPDLLISCIHIAHNKIYLQQQKIDLLWRMLDKEINKSVDQVHLIYSKVSLDDKNNKSLNIQQLLQTRTLQIASAFKSKYGEKQAAFFTKEMMEDLSKASLRFEFLSIRPTLEFRISTNKNCFEDRSGLFVFYNYARISTLLDKFNKHVSEGLYPPLPEVDQIDLERLRLQEEWDLVFNYLLEFPTIIMEAVTRNENGSVKFITTHKLCQFLSSLSKNFSKYYSKTHILGDPLPHLLPTMYARLYLVISVRHVYDNALYLLSIKPLHRL